MREQPRYRRPVNERFGFLRDDHGGVTVVVDGQQQSYVDPADPGLLAFEYVAQMAAVIATLPTPSLRFTHIGGAGLTLPRWLAQVRPTSPQIVFEPDSQLTDAVRRELPLPRRHRIRVRPLPGREGVAALAAASADAVVLDAFASGRVPADLVTTEFFREVARVLDPAGLLIANVADEPGLEFAHGSRPECGKRSARWQWFPPTTCSNGADSAMSSIASRSALNDAALTRAIAGLSIPSGYWPPGDSPTRRRCERPARWRRYSRAGATRAHKLAGALRSAEDGAPGRPGGAFPSTLSCRTRPESSPDGPRAARRMPHQRPRRPRLPPGHPPDP